MRSLHLRTAALIVALAAACALGAALAEQHWAGLAPCALCLLERWPWRAAIVLALLAATVPPRPGRWSLGLAAVALLCGFGLGLTHVGVEQGWWPDPLPQCAAPHFSAGSLAQRLASMPLRPAKPCDAPAYLIPGLPLSMAAMDAIYALVVASATLCWLFATRGSRR